MLPQQKLSGIPLVLIRLINFLHKGLMGKEKNAMALFRLCHIMLFLLFEPEE